MLLDTCRSRAPAPAPEPGLAAPAAAPAAAPTEAATPTLASVVAGAGRSEEPAPEAAVTLVRAGKRGPLPTGAALTAGDEIVTAPAARARFGLGAARFELLPASRLAVEGPGSLRLLGGAVDLEAGAAAAVRLKVAAAEVTPRAARLRAALDAPPAP
ncbi:MAG TPA: hypothetical protein VGQ83_39585, partial [Polyangia bacterium]